MPVAEIVQLHAIAPGDVAPFDTIEHAHAMLSQLEVMVELARAVLAKADEFGRLQTLAGVRQVVDAGLNLTGLG